jgi:hypothetical protein
VFAGAAREAVFSQPEVIRRVNRDFVPVALKAALVNDPPAGEEGRLCREIGRSRPAPQGICVANSAGKVLDWALMFDDDRSVLAFLDHARDRFREHPDASRPVAAERYMKFPSRKLADVEDTEVPLPTVDRHADSRCPARAPVAPGTLAVRLYGRALDADGRPIADTVRQEHYVEDRFDLSPELQEMIARDLAKAGPDGFRLPGALYRLLASHAFLGQLDVNPLEPPGDVKGELKPGELWARREEPAAAGTVRLRVEGRSEVAGGRQDGSPGGRGAAGDGRIWEHSVRLTWEGFIDMDGSRITRLVLTARGTERLKWGNISFGGAGPDPDVARLPAGHPIDFQGEVLYGLIGEPARAE